MKSQFKKAVALLAMSFAVVVAAAGLITIDTRNHPAYGGLSNVDGVNIGSSAEVRTAGLTQTAATYRLMNGMDKLPANSEFRIIWPDGSSERATVTSPFSTVGAVPVPGSKSGGGQGGGLGGGSGGFDPGGTDNPFPPVGPMPPQDGCANQLQIGCA